MKKRVEREGGKLRGMSVLADTERVKELARLAAEADAEAAADGQLMETQAHVCHILP
jgi:hypothetical protein